MSNPKEVAEALSLALLLGKIIYGLIGAVVFVVMWVGKVTWDNIQLKKDARESQKTQNAMQLQLNAHSIEIAVLKSSAEDIKEMKKDIKELLRQRGGN